MTAPRRIIFFALFPFACGYFLSYLLRAVNAVVAPDLVRDFGVSPAELGVLTSAYLLSFSLFQLPLGVFLDRYGARRVQTVLLAIAAAGCFLFAAAPDFFSLVASRAIIGLGFSAGLMASFKASSIWVPPERRSLANASIMSAGALGIIMATEPTAWLVTQVGWRAAFVIFGAIILAGAAFVFLAVPEKEGEKVSAGLGRQVARARGNSEAAAVLAHRPHAGAHRRRDHRAANPLGRAVAPRRDGICAPMMWPAACSGWRPPSWSASSSSAWWPTACRSGA